MHKKKHTTDPEKFWHEMHLQLSPQNASPSKHSQYFFRHCDFLQLHPVECPCCIGYTNSQAMARSIFMLTKNQRLTTVLTLLSKAPAFLSFVTWIATCRACSVSARLLQSMHLQLLQYLRAAKHSQYLIRTHYRSQHIMYKWEWGMVALHVQF